MRFALDTLAVSLLLFTSTPAIAHPQPQPLVDTLIVSEPLAERAESEFADVEELWKRKGGGGGGGRGGGGGTSGGGSSGGGTSSGGAGSGGTSSGGRTGSGSSGSNTGGSSRQGSGVQPSYGGGRYYGGGATTPYRSGLATPLGLAAVGIGAGALLFYPWYFPYGGYSYRYNHTYGFRNRSATADNNQARDLWTLAGRQDAGVEQMKPVECVCQAYMECGCDDNGNTTFLDSIIGDGSYAALNKTLVDVVMLNGNSTIVLNGTLPNGTTTSGGTEDIGDDSNSTSSSGSDGSATGGTGAGSKMLQASGWAAMIATVGCTVLLV